MTTHTDVLPDIKSVTNLQGMADLLNPQRVNQDKAFKVTQDLTDKFRAPEVNDNFQFDKYLKDVDLLSKQLKFDAEMEPEKTLPPVDSSKYEELEFNSSEVRSDYENDKYESNNAHKYNTDFIGDAASLPRYDDSRLSKLTQEEEHQRIMFDVLGQSTKDIDDDDNFIAKQEEEDLKYDILGQIDLLREILNEEGVPIDNIQMVDASNTVDEIKFTLRTLRRKNNCNRNTMLAEDVILGITFLLEELCDGKKVYFGRTPDLRGWHKTVNTKLRRMRPDTNEIAQNVTEGLGMGPGMRIALELIPSAFIFARKRQTQHDSHAISDDEVRQATDDIIKDD